MKGSKRTVTIGTATWVIGFGCLWLATPQPAHPSPIDCPNLCPTPTVTCGEAIGTSPGAVNTTSTSTRTCTGSSSQVIVSTTTYIGPQTLCYGTNQTESCSIVAGGQDIDTLYTAIVANTIAIPTLSIWGLVSLVAGLGALALRRLRV
jgi:IPTL-CTERM motif